MKEFAVLSFFIAIVSLSIGLLKRPKTMNALEKIKMNDDDQPFTKVSSIGKKGPVKRIAEKFSSDSQRFSKQRLLLKQADIPMTYEEVLLFKTLFIISLGLLAYAVSRDLFIVVVVVLVIWQGPTIAFKMRRKNAIVAFDGQLNDGIVIMSNALKAGYSFLQALAVAAEECADPLGKTFKLLLKELSLGMEMEDALSNMIRRMPSEDLMLMVNAILIQKDIGGNLSEILENISETIRERQKIKNEVKTLTAQGKLSGGIVMALPIFLGGVIYLFNKSYILILFTTPLGRILIGFALGSQFLGWLMIKKIITIDL